MRYRTLLKQTVDGWKNRHGVVQIVTLEGSDENELWLCYHKNDEFLNRPLTISPSPEADERTGEIVETDGGSRMEVYSRRDWSSR